MKTEFETHDIQAIVKDVVDALRPYLVIDSDKRDLVFDKAGLAEYLQVDVSWINKQITDRAIPYIKVGKYTRFKKSHIDNWLEDRAVGVLSCIKQVRRR